MRSSASVSAHVTVDVPEPVPVSAGGGQDVSARLSAVPFVPERGLGGGRRSRRGANRRGWRAVAGVLAVVLLALPVSACGSRHSAGASPTLSRDEALARAKERYVSARASASAAGPSQMPTASASPSAVPSLSPEAQASKDQALSTPLPPRLERMDENSPEGASQAAKYFMLLYTYTYTTGDTKPWQDVSENECRFCENLVNVTKELHDGGGWADHWSIAIYTISHRKPASDYNYTIVDIELTNPSTIEYDSFGNGTQTDREENKVLRLALNYTNGRWVIHGGRVVK